jgi:FixJ family two-component response regulator
LTTDAAGGANILIVEDDPDVRAVLSRMATGWGYRVLTASTGRQALGIIRNARVDVVLSDLVMPKMSGLMLLHSMLEQGFQMPFILISGFGDKDSAIQALRLGAFDFLEKPVHESELQAVLGEAVKTAAEQQTMLELARSRDAAHRSVDADAVARFQILKMRVFRGDSIAAETSVVPPSGTAVPDSWTALTVLFAQEAEPQLSMVDAALTGVASAENPGREIVYALRVVQSARMAAESLRLMDVAELAWSLETALAACRRVGVDKLVAHVELLKAGTNALREAVARLADPAVRELRGRLAELANAESEKQSA